MQTDNYCEKGMINAESIFDSLELQNGLLEEKNAMLAYALYDWEAAEDQAERPEYMLMMRKQHM